MELQRTTHTKQLADDVGIVVIGRNEGARLIDCLTSIEPRKFTTVYVDSGSTDDSVAAAERLGATVVRLDMMRSFTAARARNEGFASLRAIRPEIQFVQFLDGDCVLDTGWLTMALAFITQRADTGVVCGRRRERHPQLSTYNWLCDVEWNTPTGEALSCGGDSLVRVKAFEAVGGFRPQLMAGEEPEFCLRLRQIGWKIWRLDAEMTRHDAAIMHFGQWWRRAVRSGYGYAEVFQIHAGSPTAIWKRELTRAVLWGGVVPLAIVVGAFENPIVIAAALIYPLQIGRIALRQGVTALQSWKYGLFMTIAKFPELQGILMYYWRCWCRRPIELIEYKQTD